MKICHVIESAATGTLSVAQMAANVQSENEIVTLVYSKRNDTPENINELFENGVRTFEVEMSLSNFPFSVFKLRSILLKEKPDVTHCHSSFAGLVGRFASLGLKTKVFYSPHCISFMRVDIGNIKKSLFKFFEFIGCIKKSTYIACSDSEKKAIESTLPFVSVKLLENAVNLKDFSSLKNKRDNQLKRIITVGGIRKQKGFTEFANIAHEFQDANVEFIWIGDGDNIAKQQLIDAGVIVSGWKSREEVIQELYSADLYLSTALWEGMPVSLIEACAANLPIVARSCAGNVDVVEHKKTGHLFDNTTEATELIEQFLQDPAPYKQYADSAYNSVFERFSVERFSKELIEIYNS